MEPILKWAERSEPIVLVIGTILLVLLTFWLVLRSLRTERTEEIPSLGLGFADSSSWPRLQVTHLEGAAAYDVLLDGFMGTLAGQSVRCAFRPIPHIGQGDVTALKVDVEGLTESPEGQVFYEDDAWVDVLRSATGRETGLPLRMRYRDVANKRYAVQVTMPHLIHLGMGLLGEWPVYSRPIPMSALARLDDIIVWPLNRAWTNRRIRRERFKARARRKSAQL